MRKLRYILWGLAIAALVAASALWFAQKIENGNVASTVKIGGSFAMTDHNGQPVTEKSYAGRATAIFFGFTFCPDICPTTLARLSALTAKLGPDGLRLQVILVSVDPERDTPKVLKEYLAAFDPSFVALTGTPEQLASFAKTYLAFYEKVPVSSGGYTMNHSAGVYLFDAAGAFVDTLDAHETDDVALQKLKRLVAH
ncbi:MAG: SCO family protein [Aestuariivirga sp.]